MRTTLADHLAQTLNTFGAAEAIHFRGTRILFLLRGFTSGASVSDSEIVSNAKELAV